MDLETYLESRNIDIKEFAGMLTPKVSPASISNYIHGKRMPTLKIAKSIEAVTRGKVTTGDLIATWEAKNKDG